MNLAVFAIFVTLLAHVGPSRTQNNRYVKVSLRPGSVRLAYTVYFGERPGAGQRRRMDADHNHLIDGKEKAKFGEALLAELGPGLRVVIDGVPVHAQWTISDVGLGVATASRGSFAVDAELIAALPDSSQKDHTLRFWDRWRLPEPGETELRVDPGPGTRLIEATLRRAKTEGPGSFRYVGATSNRVLRVTFKTDPSMAQPVATAEPTAPAGRHVWLLSSLLALAALAVRWAYRRRHTN